MNVIALIQLIAWTVYAIITLKKFKATPSLSHTHYEWQEVRGYERTFEFFMAFIGVSMWLYGLYEYKFWASTMAGLSGLGLCIVGVGSEFRKDDVETIHSTGAVSAILLGFMAIRYQYGWEWAIWLFVIFLVICGILKFIKGVRESYTLMVEHVAFYIVVLRLMFV